MAFSSKLLDGQLPATHLTHTSAIALNILFLIFRHTANSLPTTYIGLEKWLQELWREKDQLLENVYKERIRMPVSSSRQNGPMRTVPMQYISLFAWLTFVFKILQTLLTTWSPFHWIWIIFISAVMAFISKYTNGLQEIEVTLDQGVNFSQIFNAVKSLCQKQKQN